MIYPWRVMSREPDGEEPTQETPEGHTIPVPTRQDVFRDLRKVARAPEPPDEDDESAGDAGGAEEQQ
jgi:hypothetical protein